MKTKRVVVRREGKKKDEEEEENEEEMREEEEEEEIGRGRFMIGVTGFEVAWGGGAWVTCRRRGGVEYVELLSESSLTFF